MQVGVDFRIRFNSELYELLNNIDVVQRINFQRLRWLDHVVRMFRRDGYILLGSTEIGEKDDLVSRWKDRIEKVLSSIGVTNWRRHSRSRSAWKDMLRETEIL